MHCENSLFFSYFLRTWFYCVSLADIELAVLDQLVLELREFHLFLPLN